MADGSGVVREAGLRIPSLSIRPAGECVSLERGLHFRVSSSELGSAVSVFQVLLTNSLRSVTSPTIWIGRPAESSTEKEGGTPVKMWCPEGARMITRWKVSQVRQCPLHGSVIILLRRALSRQDTRNGTHCPWLIRHMETGEDVRGNPQCGQSATDLEFVNAICPDQLYHEHVVTSSVYSIRIRPGQNGPSGLEVAPQGNLHGVGSTILS